MDAITRHHYTNIANGNAIENADGTLSTVRNITVEMGGKVFVLPTVWDGREVDTSTAIDFARKTDVDWPSFESEKEANAWYSKTKKTWEPIGNDAEKAKELLSGKSGGTIMTSE